MKQKNISKLLSADEFYFPILNHCALAIWSNKRKKNGVKIANNSRSFSSMLSHFLSQQSAKLVTDWIYPKLGFFWFGNHPIWPKYVRIGSKVVFNFH